MCIMFEYLRNYAGMCVYVLCGSVCMDILYNLMQTIITSPLYLIIPSMQFDYGT